MLECPIWSQTYFALSPCAMSIEAKKCRRSWNRTPASPAAAVIGPYIDSPRGIGEGREPSGGSVLVPMEENPLQDHKGRSRTFVKGFRIHLIADNGAVTMRLLLWGAILTALVAGWAPAQTAAVAVDGTVKDGAGQAVAGAIVTLETAAGAGQRTTATDQAGAFHFGDVAAGSHNVTVAAAGFAAWTANVTAGVLNQAPVAAVLQVAPVTSTIEVTPPPKEVAAEQVKSEEKAGG